MDVPPIELKTMAGVWTYPDSDCLNLIRKINLLRSDKSIGEEEVKSFVFSRFCVISRESICRFFCVFAILMNVLDPRMTTNMKFKGMIVCYGRFGALRKITGVAPPWKVDQFSQDTAAVDFYLGWAVTKGIIRNKKDIDIEFHKSKYAKHSIHKSMAFEL